MEIDTHSHVPLRMNSNSLCDILISHLALSSGQNVHFSSTLVCDKVPQMLADYVFTTSCDANWPKRCSCKCSLHFLEHYYPCEFTRFTVSICLFSTITLAKWCSTIKLLFFPYNFAEIPELSLLKPAEVFSGLHNEETSQKI